MSEQNSFTKTFADRVLGREDNLQTNVGHRLFTDAYRSNRLEDLVQRANPPSRRADIADNLNMNTQELYARYAGSAQAEAPLSLAPARAKPQDLHSTKLPSEINTAVAPGAAPQKPKAITDCSPGCVVGGITYHDKFEIPGFAPQMLIGPDHKPVYGPDGKAVFGPAIANIKEVQEQFAKHPVSSFFKFGYNGPFDFQRRLTDKGEQIFYGEYKDFTNIVVGLGAANAKIPRVFTTAVAAAYALVQESEFHEPMSPVYRFIPKRNVRDYEIGYKLWQQQQHGQ